MGRFDVFQMNENGRKTEASGSSPWELHCLLAKLPEMAQKLGCMWASQCSPHIVKESLNKGTCKLQWQRLQARRQPRKCQRECLIPQQGMQRAAAAARCCEPGVRRGRGGWVIQACEAHSLGTLRRQRVALSPQHACSALNGWHCSGYAVSMGSVNVDNKILNGHPEVVDTKHTLAITYTQICKLKKIAFMGTQCAA
eukprot:353313-Chlamydomonas_euryale.AAC.8